MITTVKPTGSVTIKPGKGRKFTMGEITDLINETMAQQKFILIRRHMTFFIHPADEKLDPTLLPRIELSELPKRGKTEIVQVIIPLEGMVVDDVQEELKRLLTPFGSMVPLVKPNFLLVTDTVGNINRIRETLERVTGDKSHSDSLDIVCEWRPAQQVADTLKTLLTDKDTTVDAHRCRGRRPVFDPRMMDPRFDRFDPDRFGGGWTRRRGGRGPGGTNPRPRTLASRPCRSR